MTHRRPRLLYLVHRVPFPPDKGDRIRNFHVLKFLSQRATVHLACLADERVPADAVAALSHLCERVAIVHAGGWQRWVHAFRHLLAGQPITTGAFWSPRFRDVVCQWARRTWYDAAVASASSMVPYLRLDDLAKVPAVVDLVDVDSQKWADYAAASRGLRRGLYGIESRRLRRLEQDLPRWTSAVTLVSKAELALYREFCVPGHTAAIGNGVDLDYFHPVQADECPDSCVFVGALDYRPNVDAACWFSREVWPEIRRFHPAATLQLVGRRPTRQVQALGDIAGVQVVGQVPNVRPYVARSQVVVAPLMIARGVQNKVLEAMAMAKPVVCSPAALAGIAARPDTDLLQASTREQWVAATTRLFDDEDLRRLLGRSARLFVESRHNWDSCLAEFAALLNLPHSPAETASHRRSVSDARCQPMASAFGSTTVRLASTAEVTSEI
jgi:sugar transferase (PEP-CTERM/EpsH1 system associated)